MIQLFNMSFEDLLLNQSIFWLSALSLSAVLELAFAWVFGLRLVDRALSGTGLKKAIVFATAAVFCTTFPVNLLPFIWPPGGSELVGQLLTAGVLTEGSKRIAEKFGDLQGAKDAILRNK